MKHNGRKYSLEVHLRIAIYIFYIFAGALFIRFALIPTLSRTAPFILAFFIAEALRKPAQSLAKRLRMPTKCACIIITAAFYALLAAALFLLFSAIITEARDISVVFSRFDAAVFVRRIEELLAALRMKFPLLDAAEPFFAELYGRFAVFAGDILKKLLAQAGKIPEWLMFFGFTVAASFLFAVDHGTVYAKIEKALPVAAAKKLDYIKNEILSCALGYFRTFFLLFLISFLVLCGGFCLLGVKSFVLLALFAALIDALPVFGAGALLIPWTGFLFASGDFARGTLAAALYITLLVVKTAAEQHLLSKASGLPAAVSMMLMCAGYYTCGFFGVLLFLFLGKLLFRVFEASDRRSFRHPGRSAP